MYHSNQGQLAQTSEDTILAESRSDGTKIIYRHDENGNYVGFILNGVDYYYIYNAQGDVVALVDTYGAVAAKYYYDAWGKLIKVTNASGTTITSSTHVGNINPIRYRGYYYDVETGLYYLQSRYYDPTVGRFINADGIVGANQDIFGYNLFAYCSNDPVNNYDPTGNFKITSLFNILKVSIKVSVKMFKHAILGGGKSQSYGPTSSVSKALSKSKIMQTEVSNNLEKYKNSGKTSATYEGSVSLYGKDNKYDFDLSYSVGKASYSMTITEETKTSGFWIFKKTNTQYVIDVTVSDIYDFDEYRNDNSFGSILNNFGYDMQKIGVIKPYYWDATYTVYEELR